jgi:hypothetical protein
MIFNLIHMYHVLASGCCIPLWGSVIDTGAEYFPKLLVCISTSWQTTLRREPTGVRDPTSKDLNFHHLRSRPNYDTNAN